MSRSLDELREENARLRDALGPMSRAYGSRFRTFEDSALVTVEVQVRDLRTARAEVEADDKSISVPSYAEVEESYERAYADWQALSSELLGREHGSREEMLRQIAHLKATAAG